MKTGTVKWFNLQKGYGFIHPDDGGPNIFVHKSAVESAGLSDLKEGQRMIFETQRNERTGDPSATLLTPLLFATTPHLDGRFVTTDPFDIIPPSSHRQCRQCLSRKEGGLTRARTRLPRPICLAENRGALRVSRNDRTCGDGYG